MDVPETNNVISLNNIVSNYFSENTATFRMKCSECIEASCQKCLVTTPTILYIQLLRFNDFQGLKIDTKVTPENVLVLPNQDKYRLVSIGKPLGVFYQQWSLSSTPQNWIELDQSR